MLKHEIQNVLQLQGEIVKMQIKRVKVKERMSEGGRKNEEKDPFPSPPQY